MTLPPIGTTSPEQMEREFREALAAETRTDREGASAFARACRDGDVDAFLGAVDFLSENTISGWRYALRRVGRLHSVSPDIRSAFLRVWIEHKHLPLAVGHRPTMARALHVLMPPEPIGEPLRLFRGVCALERQRGAYGFSWSTQRDIAKNFAEQARWHPLGAVVLETTVSDGAVHLRREEEGYYDEGEVVVDPYRLGRVRVVERLPSVRPTA